MALNMLGQYRKKLYTPIIGVVKVQAAMIGENRKLTLEVPYFCNKNSAIRTPADEPSTAALNMNKEKN